MIDFLVICTVCLFVGTPSLVIMAYKAGQRKIMGEYLDDLARIRRELLRLELEAKL